jgi:hypothetical protein
VSHRQVNIELADVTAALVQRIPAMLCDVRDALAVRQPEYASFLAERLDEVGQAAAPFMARLVESARGSCNELSTEVSALEQAAFEEVGRQQFQQGREITSLLAAYRIGARVAWQHASDAVLSQGFPAGALAALGSALFSAVDEMSAASLRGYLEEHAVAMSSRERSREELAELLLSDRAERAAVRAAAERAGWRLPAKAAVILVDPDNEVARKLLSFDGDVCLRLWRDDRLIAILPDPDAPGRRDRLVTTLRGVGAVLGVPVPIDQLPVSLSIARLAAGLRRRRVLAGDPLFAEDHLDTLIVHQDDRLLAALRARCLAPLSGLREPSRQRLEETLRSWLHNLGDQKAVAAELHIHPQTVRYRLRQLRERYGAALDDARLRESLVLALAWGQAAA